MKDTDIVGSVIRETPWADELSKCKEEGDIRDFVCGNASFPSSDKVPTGLTEYGWDPPVVDEPRFAYEWRGQIVPEEDIYIVMVTRVKIRTAEEFDAARKKLANKPTFSNLGTPESVG